MIKAFVTGHGWMLSVYTSHPVVFGWRICSLTRGLRRPHTHPWGMTPLPVSLLHWQKGTITPFSFSKLVDLMRAWQNSLSSISHLGESLSQQSCGLIPDKWCLVTDLVYMLVPYATVHYSWNDTIRRAYFRLQCLHIIIVLINNVL